MKFILLVVFVCTSALAAEVGTDCPAMNHSRDKIIKDVSSAKKVRSGSRVVSQ